jgi:cyclophilin family peptidyl-prolyl cis-trans isomerase
MAEDGGAEQVIARRLTAVLTLAVALSSAACGEGEPAPTPESEPAAAAPAQAVTPAGNQAAVSVRVEAAAAEVIVGEEILLTVTVTNDGSEKTRVNVPRLDRSCATVRVRLPGDDPYVLERLYADLNPQTGRLEWQVPEARELAPGESLTGELSLTAAQPGKHHMTVAYRRSVREDALTADAIEVTVNPDGGKSKLGAEIMTSEGGLTVRLRPDLAPNTVESFASLARDGFFDGLKFHRIMKGFMAQGGDPKGTGEGGPGYFLPLETNRELLHDRGVLSMARTGLPDTAGSQFFLMFTRYPSLDPGAAGPGYTTFGETVEGDEALTALESVVTEIPKAMRERIEAQGIPQEQIDMLVRAGRIEKSSPVERTEIKTVRIVAID